MSTANARASVGFDLDALTGNRTDPACRLVLEDYERDTQRRIGRVFVALQIDADADAADDAADDADDDAADDAAADADDLSSRMTRNLFTEPDMREGLKIIVLPGGYYGRGAFRVGWLRRVSGDEYELYNARTIKRSGAYQLGGFDKLREDGSKGYSLSPIAKLPEEVNRLLVKRCGPADEKAWAAECPKPKGWESGK